MIGYVMLGTNNFDDAAKFYDDLLSTMGAGRFMENERFIAWANAPTSPAICICKPYDGEKATVGNGVMVAVMAGSREQVDAIHAKALQLGGTDEGAPGQRSDNFYAGYFRDLDGNKLNIFYMGE